MGTPKHGVNSRLYMGSSTAIPIAESHTLKFEVKTDFAEDSAQGDTWKTYLPGLSDLVGSLAKWYDAATHVVMDAVINRTLQKAYFYPDAADSANYIWFCAYVGGGGWDADIGKIVDQAYEIRPTTQPTYVHS